ncbi:MAG TPA: cytochrome b/b6 domain-containing protein [Rhodoblastus sp.]|nr:cytochrome b/b6 domain-containing protein [Rhodoblastus sp.]
MLPQRYDSIARSLHWASAFLIVAAFVMGLTIDTLPREQRAPYLNAHALAGLAVAALALVRLGWRAGHAAPPSPQGSSAFAILASRLGHGALYLMMFAVPMIGFAPLFARGRGIDFGLFQIASPIERAKEWIGPTTEIHEIAAYALIALAVGHVAAAIYHHVALKDGVLLRMMPERRA